LLHVVDRQRHWLLPAEQITAVYKTPAVQPIPTSSVFSGLVVHRRSVYGAIRLARIWDPAAAAASDDAAGWGLVFGRHGGEVVFLVEDVVGHVSVAPHEIEWADGDPDEPLLGIRVLDDRPQLLLDPLRSPLLKESAHAEDDHPWLEVRSLSETIEGRSGPSPLEQVVVVEDADYLLALPARSVFEVGRIADDAPGPPRLTELITDSGPSGRHPSFRCRIGGPAGSVEACFDELLTWHSVDPAGLRPWPGMGSLSLSGAFVLAGRSRPVLLIDPTQVLKKHGKHERARSRPSGPQAPASPRRAQPMSSGAPLRLILLRANQRQAALPLSSIRHLSSWRRAQVYNAGVSHHAIVGILERAGRFSTIVDLGALLESGAVRPSPDSRLVTLDTPSGLMTLLVDSISGPFEVDGAAVRPADQPQTMAGPDRMFMGTIAVDGAEEVPIVDPAAVVALVDEQADD